MPQPSRRPWFGGVRAAAAGAVLFVCLAPVAWASAASRFDSWTTENGLPQNSVNDILQTRDGYLWLATEGGLVRFDGVRFVVYDRSVEGIGSARIRALHEARDGTLWAGTEDGLLIRRAGGRFTTFRPEDGLPGGPAVRIEEDVHGRIWVTWLGAITRTDGQRFETLRPQDFGNDVQVPGRREYLDVWWSQRGSDVRALIAGRVQTYSLPAQPAPVAVSGVNVDRRGNAWIRTRGAGVFKAASGGITRYTTRHGLPSDSPDGLFFAGGDGETWFAAFAGSGYRIANGSHDVVAQAPLRSFFVDREGSTWVGTTTQGLLRVRRPVVSMLDGGGALSADVVYSILQDRSGTVWLVSSGLDSFVDGRFARWSAGDGAAWPAITCVYEDRGGRLWIGSDDGLWYLDRGRFVRWTTPPGLLERPVRWMHQDAAGVYWMATDAGLVRWQDGRFRRYTKQDGLADDRTTLVFEDRTGALWIGGYRGLTRLHDGRFTAYREADGFIGNWVRAIHEDGHGVLWVGTYDGGLYRLEHGRLTRYTRDDGLHDNGVFQILDDGLGHLWMGSNRGIYRVSHRALNEFAAGTRRSVTSFAIGVQDGMATLEVNGGRQPAGLRAGDGRLWFPTMRGVAVVDPALIEAGAAPLTPVVEEVRLGGRQVPFADGITLSPGAPVLDVQFTAAAFIRSEQVRFRYKLNGLDDDWIDAGEHRTASFHRLPAGRYLLTVAAARPDGPWHAAESAVTVVVLPPFWQTPWFVALAILGAVAMGYGSHHARVRRLRAQHALQIAFSQQLIDSQERERRRLSHELHDSLGQHVAMIRRRTRMAIDAAGHAPGTLEDLELIGSLARAIATEIKEIAQGLGPYHLDQLGLVRTITRMVRQVSDVSGTEFVVELAPIDDLVPEPARIHVFRIVQESVSNVVKHAQARRGRVTITIEDGGIRIVVEDDGRGPVSLAGSTAATVEGMGVRGLRERARILGADIRIGSRVGGGTTVEVTIPLPRRGRG